MHTFLGNFRRWLDARGISHTDDINAEYDVMFVNSWAVPHRRIAHEKRRRPKLRVIHRIDGSARGYGRNDDADERQALANLWADVTVFQSDYSRVSTREHRTIIVHDGPTIYNAVDVSAFRPRESSGDTGLNIRVCNASFSTNRLKGTWQLADFASRHREVTFVLCGRYPELPHLPNLVMMGHLGRSELANAMGTCDVFLHLASHDPCPNVVLEALASGLPVLYRDSGGTPELVGPCGLPVDVDSFGERLAALRLRRDELRRAARHRAVARYSPDVIFPQYIEQIARAERHPIPRLRERVRLARLGFPVAPGQPRLLYWRARRLAGRALGRTGE